MDKLNFILSPDYFMDDIVAFVSEFASGLHKEIKDTSPVDEGTYKAGWGGEPKQVGKVEFLIENRVRHAKYLIYGISLWKMNFPRRQRYVYPNRAEGAIHDVRKIVWVIMQRMKKELKK
jgi:hypothetical protein